MRNKIIKNKILEKQEKMEKDKLQEKREKLFKKVDDLDNVLYILEATANTYYSPDENMWDVLLKARDIIKKHIKREELGLYRETEKINEEISEINKRDRNGKNKTSKQKESKI